MNTFKTTRTLLLALGLAMTGCDSSNLGLIARDFLEKAQTTSPATRQNASASRPGMAPVGHQASFTPDGGPTVPSGAVPFQGRAPGQGPRTSTRGDVVQNPTAGPSDRDPNCEPRCYPGAEEDFRREQEAVRQNPLRVQGDLAGRWDCASGLGYLEVGYDSAGQMVGRIIVEQGEGAGPVAHFENVELRDGRVEMVGRDGRLSGLAGQTSAGAPPEILAVFGEATGAGERPVRFTRS